MLPIQFQRMANMMPNVAVKASDTKYLFTADPFNFPEFLINGSDINENNRMMENETQIIKDIIILNNSFNDYQITGYFSAKEKNICREDEKVVNLKVYFVKGVEINHHNINEYNISPYIYIPSSCQKSLNEGILIIFTDIIQELTSKFYILVDDNILKSKDTDLMITTSIKRGISIKDSMGLFTLEHIINALTGIIDIVYYSNPTNNINTQNIFESYPSIDRINDSMVYKFRQIEMYECSALKIKYISVINYLCKRLKDEIVNNDYSSLVKNILYSIGLNNVLAITPLSVIKEYEKYIDSGSLDPKHEHISLEHQHGKPVDISKELFNNVENVYKALSFITSSDFVTSSNYLNKKIKYLKYLQSIGAIY